MSIERMISDAVVRRADAVRAGENAWEQVSAHVARRARRRRAATALLTATTLAVATIGIAVAIPRMGRDDTTGFADASSGRIRTYRTVMVTRFDGQVQQESRTEMWVDVDRKLMRIVSSVGDQPMEGFVTEEHFFLRIPEVARADVPEGKTWARLPAEAGARVESPILPRGDLVGYLDQLEEIGTVSEQGTKSIRGVVTRAYRIVVDPERFEREYKTLNAEQPPDREKALEQERRPRDAHGEIRAWIGAHDDLPYRVEFDAGVDGEQIFSQMDFFDFNVPVDIAIPSEDEVFEGDPFGGRSAEGTFELHGTTEGTPEPSPRD